MGRSTPRRANYARSLRPYLEEVPAPYRELLHLAQGQALRLQHLLGSKPLRYRLVDWLHARLRRAPGLLALLRRCLLALRRFRR
jgi:hypothetical protein